MSGWAEVDYDPAVWIRLPRIWGEQTWPDHRAWARGLAAACWGDSGLVPGEYQVDNLALAMFAEKVQSGELATQDLFLHLPDPRMMPLQVCLNIGDAEGEREAALRELTGADDPQAVEPPIVEAFPTEHLGQGPSPNPWLGTEAIEVTPQRAAWRLVESGTAEVRPTLDALIGAALREGWPAGCGCCRRCRPRCRATPGRRSCSTTGPWTPPRGLAADRAVPL